MNEDGGARVFSRCLSFFILNVPFYPPTYCVDSQLKDRKPLADIVVEAQDVHGELEPTQRMFGRGVQWRHDFAPNMGAACCCDLLCDPNPSFTQSRINFIHDPRTHSAAIKTPALDSIAPDMKSFWAKLYFDSQRNPPNENYQKVSGGGV